MRLLASVCAVAGALLAVLCAPVAVAKDPTVVFLEDFENPVTRPTLLTDYQGAPVAAHGATYRAASGWLRDCNGWVVTGATPQPADTRNCNSNWASLQVLARTFGIHRGDSDPDANHAVVAYTANCGDTASPQYNTGNVCGGANQVQWETSRAIAVAPDRHYTLSFDAQTRGCGNPRPRHRLSIIAGGTEMQTASGLIDVCVSYQREISGSRVGTIVADTPALISTSSVDLRLVNALGSTAGNDGAFDNIALLDVTPGLAKAFSPASIREGGRSRLTFTVENTSDLLAKRGIAFTDHLPAGVVVADPASAATTCPSGVVTAPAGGATIAVTLELTAGLASCTIAVDVTAAAHGTYVNRTFSGVVGIDPAPPATLTVEEPLADLRITKVAEPAQTLLGTQVRYTLTVVNDGPYPAHDVRVDDSPAPGLLLLGATPSQGVCASPSSCALGTLAVGQTATIAVTATAIGLGMQGNTATVSSSTRDPAPSDNTSTASIRIDPHADLSIVKKANVTRVAEGDDFTYTLTVRNDGPSTAEQVVVTDAIPAGVGVRSVRSSRGSCTQRDPVVCQLGDMAAGTTATITILVTATDAGRPVNSAIVSSATIDPDPTDNRDSTGVESDRTADVELTKRVSRGHLLVGASFTYTLVARNAGPSRATEVVVTDRIPAGLRIEQVTTSRGSCAGGPLIVCQLGTLANGQSATIKVTVTAVRAGTPVNGAAATSETPDPDPSDNAASVPVEVGTEADLSLTKTASAATVAAGSTVTYDVAVRNSGPNTATAVTVTDPIPAGARIVSATSSAGSCTVGSATIVCRLGDLADGATATVKLTAVYDQAGSTRNVAQVTSSTPDPDRADNQGESEVTAERADLVVRKAVSDRAPALGGSVSYRIVVANRGPDRAEGVVMTDPIPTGLRGVTATTTAGSCAVFAPALVCELGDLAAGEGVTVTVSARAALQGRIDNVASAIARFPSDPAGGDNLAGGRIDVRPGRARLAISKRASKRHVAVSDRVVYRIAVRNLGTRTAHGVRVCDRLPSGLAYVRRSGSKLAGGKACWVAGRLGPGAARSYTVLARVLGGGAQRLTYTATATSSNSRAVRATATVARSAQQGRGGGVVG